MLFRFAGGLFLLPCHGLTCPQIKGHSAEASEEKTERPSEGIVALQFPVRFAFFQDRRRRIAVIDANARRLEHQLKDVFLDGTPESRRRNIIDQKQINEDHIRATDACGGYFNKSRSFFIDLHHLADIVRIGKRFDQFIFIGEFPLENLSESLIFFSAHHDVNVIVPRDKALMSDRAEHAAVTKRIVDLIPVADGLEVHQNIQQHALQFFYSLIVQPVFLKAS